MAYPPPSSLRSGPKPPARAVAPPSPCPKAIAPVPAMTDDRGRVDALGRRARERDSRVAREEDAAPPEDASRALRRGWRSRIESTPARPTDDGFGGHVAEIRRGERVGRGFLDGLDDAGQGAGGGVRGAGGAPAQRHEVFSGDDGACSGARRRRFR